MDNLKKWKRHSIRLKGYDYSKSGMYFITICTKDRRNIFGKVEKDIMILSEYGIIANKMLKKFEEKLKKKILIKEYVIMPNHLHFIIEIKVDNETKIENLITTYKSLVTKNINKKRHIIVWQRNYYEHIIRNEKEMIGIIEYIQNNPRNWNEDYLNIV